MCGRYSITMPVEAMRRLFNVTEGALPNWPARYNVAPTQDVPIVRLSKDGARELVTVRWGLVPAWSTEIASSAPLINARADSLASKPSFREAFRKRRCLVPADGFYEWQPRGKGLKQPFRISRPDGAPFAFAGLWERWHGPDGRRVDSMCIVTTDAPPSLAAIHHRVPAVLAEADWARWLDAVQTPPEEAIGLAGMPPDGLLAAYPVSTRVNAVANDDASLWEPQALPDVGAPGRPVQGTLF